MASPIQGKVPQIDLSKISNINDVCSRINNHALGINKPQPHFMKPELAQVFECENARTSLLMKKFLDTGTFGTSYLIRIIKNPDSSLPKKIAAGVGAFFTGLVNVGVSLGSLGLVPIFVGVMGAGISSAFLKKNQIEEKVMKERTKTAAKDIDRTLYWENTEKATVEELTELSSFLSKLQTQMANSNIKPTSKIYISIEEQKVQIEKRIKQMQS